MADCNARVAKSRNIKGNPRTVTFLPFYKQSKDKYVFSFSFSLLPALSYMPLFATYTKCTTITVTLRSLDLHNGNIQTTTVSFTRNFTQGWLYSWFVLSNTNSLTKGLEVKRSGFHLLENSFSCLYSVLDTFRYLSVPHGCCSWFTCSMDLLVCIYAECIVYTLPLSIIVIYLFHTHNLKSKIYTVNTQM